MNAQSNEYTAGMDVFVVYTESSGIKKNKQGFHVIWFNCLDYAYTCFVCMFPYFPQMACYSLFISPS